MQKCKFSLGNSNKQIRKTGKPTSQSRMLRKSRDSTKWQKGTEKRVKRGGNNLEVGITTRRAREENGKINKTKERHDTRVRQQECWVRRSDRRRMSGRRTGEETNELVSSRQKSARRERTVCGESGLFTFSNICACARAVDVFILSNVHADAGLVVV